ncbi:hypothetical protein DFP73DRAFT_348217 [Morchella snyderi]|nr:hypothetical protein DFP73DRAFT_348217 [Morchella snyderi]
MDTTTRTPEVEPSPRRQNVRRGPTPAPESAINNITENSLKTSALPSPICFRIRGIPPHWESEDVMEHLKSNMHVYNELDWKAARLSGPFPSPFGDSQCALLNLDRCTDHLGTIFSDQKTEEYSVIEVNQKTFHMVIDRHFYDLTPLNKPSLPIVADVIAITGLGGHAFGSWRSRRRTSRPIERPMWIRDFLPERFPNTRIMTYGYNCSLVNPNETRMMDYRQNLDDALLNARRDCKDRKMIFIGHSLGALLIIQFSGVITRHKITSVTVFVESFYLGRRIKEWMQQTSIALLKRTQMAKSVQVC